MFNSADFTLADGVYNGFSHLDNVYTVRIEESSVQGLNGMVDTSKVIYTLVKNKVKSFGAARDGRLKIAFSIPKGYRLPSGVDPMKVMDEIEATFIKQCMSGPDPISGVCYFNNGMLDSHVADSIGMKYPLEPCDEPFRAMNPAGEIAYVEAKTATNIRNLMSDVQYAEFQPYKEVVIAESTLGSSYRRLDGLEIPRRQSYQIIKVVDGKFTPTQLFLKSSSDEIMVPAPVSLKPYYKYDPVTLRLDSINNMVNVRLDKANEKIYVSFTLKPVEKQYLLKINSSDIMTDDYLKRHPAKLFIEEGNTLKRVFCADNRFELSGDDNNVIDHQKLNVKIEEEPGYEIKIGPISYEADGKTVSCRISAIKQKPQTPPRLSNPYNQNVKNGHTNSSSPYQSYGGDFCSVCVTLMNESMIEGCKYITIKLVAGEEDIFINKISSGLGEKIDKRNSIESSQPYPSQYNDRNYKRNNIHNERKNHQRSNLNSSQVAGINSNQPQYAIQYRMFVPKNILRHSLRTSLFVETAKWESDARWIDTQCNDIAVDLYPEMDDNGGNSNKIQVHNKSIINKLVKKYWQLSVICLLVLCLGCVFAKDKWESYSQKNKEEAVATERVEAMGYSSLVKEKIDKEEDSISNILASDHVAFESIQNMKGYIDGSNPNQIEGKLRDTIKAYLQIVEYIQEKDFEDLEKFVKGDVKINSVPSFDYIHESHKPLLRGLVAKKDNTSYDENSMKKVKRNFESDKFKPKTFEDLKTLEITYSDSIINTTK